jgi:hypothetical protein
MVLFTDHPACSNPKPACLEDIIVVAPLVYVMTPIAGTAKRQPSAAGWIEGYSRGGVDNLMNNGHFGGHFEQFDGQMDILVDIRG